MRIDQIREALKPLANVNTHIKRLQKDKCSACGKAWPCVSESIRIVLGEDREPLAGRSDRANGRSSYCHGMESPLDLLDVPDLDERLAAVNARLLRTCSVGEPEYTASSARMVVAGGKRLRPALTVAIANLGHVFDDRVIAAAAAVELVQVGSLVHDDIFDEALTRRGTPTINAVEGRNEALLAGTYLLARAGAEAASAGQLVAVDIARTVARLCVGQATETEHIFDVDQDLDQYLFKHRGQDGGPVRLLVPGGGADRRPADRTARPLRPVRAQLRHGLPDHRRCAGPDRGPGPAGQAGRSRPARRGADHAGAVGAGRPAGRRPTGAPDPAGPLRTCSRPPGWWPSPDRIAETIEAARRYAEAASSAIGSVPGTTALAFFPQSYLDWSLEQFLAA